VGGWANARAGCLIALASVVFMANSWDRAETQMNAVPLDCELELVGGDDGQTGLGFILTNSSDESVTVQYMEPFIDFSLRASADDGDVEIIQPMYDIGAHDVSTTLAAGERLRIPAPFRLRFGPPEPPPGDSFLWTLVHEPAPVELEVTIRLDGAAVGPCTALLEPGA